MKVAILTFSLTGNTDAVARGLQAKLSERGTSPVGFGRRSNPMICSTSAARFTPIIFNITYSA